MVVLAASVLSKTGKALVSRQYVDMSRIRIEGLLAAFPKLVGSGGKQHTYVETENVRYVYQPMEGLYVVLVTNKQSNILEDLETLRLVSKLVPEFCLPLSDSGLLEEEAVSLGAFDLIFGFDEVISLGHKENTTLLQVRQNCDMESHEEKLHKMIIQSKINDTKDVMKQKAMEIDKVKMETRKNAGSTHLPATFSSLDRPAIDSMRASSRMSSDSGSRPDPIAARPAVAASASRGPSKGMKLGQAKKGNDFLQSLAKEGEAVELEAPPPSAGGAAGAGAAGAAAIARPAEPVSLDIEERLAVALNKEGGLESLEVQGTVSLVVHSDDDAFVRVAIATGANKGFQFKTHPNIDKGAYSSNNVLGLKDPSRPFPTGSELGILKWRMASKDEGMVPLTINCWPSVSGGQSYVNIEYESAATFDLHNVVITIPLPHSGPPTVNQVDGDWKYDSKRGALVWTIELIDATNSSGSMEFVVPAADSSSFYPVEVAFASNKTFCDISVEAVTHTVREDAPVRFTSNRKLVTTDYTVS